MLLVERAGLAAAARGEEPDLCTAALDDEVGDKGGAMNGEDDRLCLQPVCLDQSPPSLQHSHRRLARGREHLVVGHDLPRAQNVPPMSKPTTYRALPAPRSTRHTLDPLPLPLLAAVTSMVVTLT
jgi:hypothetical protein